MNKNYKFEIGQQVFVTQIFRMRNGKMEIMIKEKKPVKMYIVDHAIENSKKVYTVMINTNNKLRPRHYFTAFEEGLSLCKTK